MIALENIQQEKAARKAVNDKLYKLGREYHEGLTGVLHRIGSFLCEEGFTNLSDGIYCGDGHTHEQVGPHTWLALSWHKMQSGRYEVVAYLS